MKLKTCSFLFAATAALALPLGADDKATEIKPTGKAPSKGIQGYWVPDKDALVAAMMKQIPDEAKADETALAAMKGMMETVAAKMAFHFTEGETAVITPTGIEKSKWKIVSEDAKTGVLKVAITKEDGSTEEGEAIVGKDKMIVINREQDMQVVCNRVTAEEWEKRATAAAPKEAP